MTLLRHPPLPNRAEGPITGTRGLSTPSPTGAGSSTDRVGTRARPPQPPGRVTRSLPDEEVVQLSPREGPIGQDRVLDPEPVDQQLQMALPL
jgi:hypothetical protein